MSKKEVIRIAHVMGKWVGGGVEAVVMNYYKHIDKNKVQFDFICDNDSTNIPYEEINNMGGNVILIPPYQKIFSYHKELKKVLQAGKYKIVHSHINTLSVFSLFAAKCAKVPVRIAHSHSTTNKKEWKKNIVKQILRPFSKVFATDYFCCSELAGRWLFGNRTYDKGKVYLLNNAIEIDKYKYDKKVRKEVRKELNIKDSTLVIGHVGRFVAQKNHTFLLDIFKEVHDKNKDSVLLLVGQGPLQDDMRCKALALHLEHNIMFLNQRDDVDRLYQAMDVFVLPSLYEGLGMVVIEAQVSGLSCVCSTEVPIESKITNNVKYIDLKQSTEVWSTTILNNFNPNFMRKINEKNILTIEYNIVNKVIKLENKYRELELKFEYEK